jgi:hypothetical protein
MQWQLLNWVNADDARVAVSHRHQATVHIQTGVAATNLTVGEHAIQRANEALKSVVR